MDLVKRPFGETFTFSRPGPADYTDANGDPQTAAANVARFDFAPGGILKGLLVEPGSGFGQHDAIVTVDGWQGDDMGTVLHEIEEDGVVRRVAFYSRTMKATVDGRLRAAGHHRSIIAIPGFLRNRGGYVRFDRRNWQLGRAIAIEDVPGAPVLGDDAGRIIIEG